MRARVHHVSLGERVEGAEHPRGTVDQPVEAGDVVGADGLDRGAHLLDVVRVVQVPAVGGEDAVEGVDRPQLDVVGEAASGQREQLVEQVRCGEDGGSGVEDVLAE